MSNIDIRHPHSLSPEQARHAVQGIADALAERFGVRCAWRGDDLQFERSGIDGRVSLQPGALHVTARLGFLFGAMKGTIEHEVRRVLEERFGRG